MIPFIVIETAKTEYRNLKSLKKFSENKANDLTKDLRLYTPGNEEISPIRINPLRIPKGVSKDSHIAMLLSLLQSAIPMSGPMPALITEALERVYEKFPSNQRPPILKDLLNTIREVLNEKSYSAETQQDILTAIEVRLSPLVSGSIGKVFQCRQNIPEIDELTKFPTILELEGLSNEQQCFLTLIVLTRITEHFKILPRSDNKLRFVIFIEEAHNIIGRTFNASPSPDNPDPKSFITELICRMLAELRSLGVGIVIIDQFPSAIAPQVIKSTATKMAFRQVDREDREIIGSSILLKKYEEEDLARLKPGEAYYNTEGLYRSRKIKTINLHEKYDFGVPQSNDQIFQLIRHEDWFIKNNTKRIASELLILQEQMNLLDNFKVECAKNIATLLAQFPTILEIKSFKSKKTRLFELKSKASEIRGDLSTNFDSFMRDFYNKYLPQNFPLHINDSELETIRQDTMDRFNSSINPDFKQLIGLVDTFIIKCKEAK